MATLRYLGQAGYLLQSGGKTAVIDPYLSNSVVKLDARFPRLLPLPMDPRELKADYFVVTHDHADHLDPETILAYRHTADTLFIAPRHAARHLREMGVPQANLRVVDHGDHLSLPGMEITGVFAMGTEKEVLDTTGYLFALEEGKTVYHTSDTGMCKLLLAACPQEADVMLCCINGKDGNLTIDEALELARAVRPRYVIPNHYDMMALVGENPLAFAYAHEAQGAPGICKIMELNEIFSF
ncbi:MAG: MBL fold metallo-hydrolase [Candidatus Limiplasma sp.]|nr:MBL fold metallo-hydrolase [Candidatus Limiplasma sp.]